MNTPGCFEVWNLFDVSDTIDWISGVLAKYDRIAIDREAAARHRNQLHATVQSMGEHGADEEYPAVYLPLLDGLGYLTMAIRRHHVDCDLLARALRCLQEAMAAGGGR